MSSSQPGNAGPRVLLLSMYLLDGELRGPPVRVTQIRDALARLAVVEVVAGGRLRRAARLAAYMMRGRLRGLDGIYVESSTAIVGPADLAFLWLARRRRIPVLTYLRDAYQLFPEYYPRDSLKRRIAGRLFPLSVRALDRVSDQIAFPSRGLASAVLRDPARAAAAPLLPPGARLADAPAVDPAARSLLYVGSLAHRSQGGELLIDAMHAARARGTQLELICVTPERDRPTGPHPAWLRIAQAAGPDIDRLLPAVLATVTPRLRSAYNDLAVPIKVLEYLGYGRPLIVTDARETAALVREAGCGVVAPASVEGLADAIATVGAASADQVRAWGDAARRAAIANGWEIRAREVLDLLNVTA